MSSEDLENKYKDLEDHLLELLIRYIAPHSDSLQKPEEYLWMFILSAFFVMLLLRNFWKMSRCFQLKISKDNLIISQGVSLMPLCVFYILMNNQKYR